LFCFVLKSATPIVFLDFFCCLSDSASCLTHPVSRTTGWLRRSNNHQATDAKHAAPNAPFTKADLTILATTNTRRLPRLPCARAETVPTLPSFAKVPPGSSAVPQAARRRDARAASLPARGGGRAESGRRTLRCTAWLRCVARLPPARAGLRAPGQPDQALAATLESHQKRVIWRGITRCYLMQPLQMTRYR